MSRKSPFLKPPNQNWLPRVGEQVYIQTKTGAHAVVKAVYPAERAARVERRNKIVLMSLDQMRPVRKRLRKQGSANWFPGT